MTSSPGPIPSAFRATSSETLPFAMASACVKPKVLHHSRSKVRHSEPVHQLTRPERRTDAAASIISWSKCGHGAWARGPELMRKAYQERSRTQRPRGHAADTGAIWKIVDDRGTGADHDIGTDPNAVAHRGTDSNPRSIADGDTTAEARSGRDVHAIAKHAVGGGRGAPPGPPPRFPPGVGRAGPPRPTAPRSSAAPRQPARAGRATRGVARCRRARRSRPPVHPSRTPRRVCRAPSTRR